jgi:hypothetical protein
MKLAQEDFETMSDRSFSVKVIEKGNLHTHFLEMSEQAIDTLPLEYQRWKSSGTIACSMRHLIHVAPAIQAMVYWFLSISPLQKQGLHTTHYRDFKTWCEKKAQQANFSISTREAAMSSGCSPRLHGSILSVAGKRKTPKFLWRRKQEPFSSRATTRTRGQEAMSHAGSSIRAL